MSRGATGKGNLASMAVDVVAAVTDSGAEASGSGTGGSDIVRDKNEVRNEKRMKTGIAVWGITEMVKVRMVLRRRDVDALTVDVSSRLAWRELGRVTRRRTHICARDLMNIILYSQKHNCCPAIP